jgi:hypothetical protein
MDKQQHMDKDRHYHNLSMARLHQLVLLKLGTLNQATHRVRLHHLNLAMVLDMGVMVSIVSRRMVAVVPTARYQLQHIQRMVLLLRGPDPVHQVALHRLYLVVVHRLLLAVRLLPVKKYFSWIFVIIVVNLAFVGNFC